MAYRMVRQATIKTRKAFQHRQTNLKDQAESKTKKNRQCSRKQRTHRLKTQVRRGWQVNQNRVWQTIKLMGNTTKAGSKITLDT